MGKWPDFQPTELLRRLTAHGVDFVVIGGIAMVAHGSSRLTQDLDVCYAPDAANLRALGESLLELKAQLRGVDEDVPFVPDDRSLRRTQILCLDTDAGPLDVLLAPPGAPSYDQLRANADRIEIAGIRVLVASLDDLAAMKRAANRVKDILDLEEIEAIRRATR